MKRKKVCFLIPTHWSFMMGGAQYQAKCIIDEIKNNNNLEIYYLAKRYDKKYTPRGYKLCKIKRIPILSRYAFFFDSIFLYLKLRKINPDVIYQRVGCAYTGVAAYYAKTNRKKIIWHIARDDDVRRYNRLKKIKDILKWIDRKLLVYGIENINCIIAQKEKQKKELYLNYNKKVYDVIKNFHPYPKEKLNKDSKITIVWIANIKKEKNPLAFLELAKNLSERYNNINFLMIGAANKENKKLQNKIDEEVINIPNLKYLGKCSIDFVNAVLAKSHIYVHTSYIEGFANTFIQAWMRKVPVVSLYSNPDNIFNRNKIGYFCGDFNTMLKVVIKLIENKKLREEMGIEAQKFAIKYHSIKNIERIKKII